MSATAKPTIRTTEEVMFFDTDAGGVMHNLAYLRMIETARTKLAVEMGMGSMKEMADQGRFPVLVRTEIDYKTPAVLSDVVQIDGGLDSVSGVRLWVEFTMTRPSDGAVLVTCRQQLAVIQLPEGKPQRIPREWRERWG